MTEEAERKQREAEQLRQSNAEADAKLRERSIAAAIIHEQTKPIREKRRRAQAQANTPEAWAKRSDFDVFDECRTEVRDSRTSGNAE